MTEDMDLVVGDPDEIEEHKSKKVATTLPPPLCLPVSNSCRHFDLIFLTLVATHSPVYSFFIRTIL